jgi:hypothetical protein
MKLRLTFCGVATIALAAAAAGCASQPTAQPAAPNTVDSPTTSLSPIATPPSSAAAASDSWAGYGEPCLATQATAVVDGHVLTAQTPGTLPTLNGPFSNIGVRFTVGGGKLSDARIDVVANATATPAAGDPTAGANESRALSAGTEPGLAARAAFTGFAQGVFSLSLGSLDTALHLAVPAGTQPTNTATAPPGATATAVDVATPPIASSYTVYIVEHLDMAACNGGSPADGLGIQALATLTP